jgi:hypothetical protein
MEALTRLAGEHEHWDDVQESNRYREEDRPATM